jgi:hypothetical protein
VAVEQPERAAEQVDPGGDERWADAVVVEDEQLDEVVEMALVIGDVDDAAAAPGGGRGEVDVLGDAPR